MNIILKLILAVSVGLAALAAGCDNNNAKKLLENKGSPFGEIGSNSDSGPQPIKAPTQNNQPFGSLE